MGVNIKVDLLKIHRQKLEKGILSISPARWCGKYGLYLDEIILQSGVPHIFEIKGQPMNKALPRINFPAHKEELGEYLACEFAAEAYRSYEPSGSEVEEAHRALYIYQSNDIVEIEVNTPVGRIDCLSETELVEIKSAPKWKAALGQILSYAYFYPKHDKVLVLYGSKALSVQKLREIRQVCDSYGVVVRAC
ncbi:hypothetical protein QRC92_001237 [Vibrio parahaemolyticus]|uniref:hypothetical protein n=1 Tax=Vibrio parahaemolyticus TaxID=670 RepID=UPI0005B6AB07|nr:hypothetical protein [Vibrio parahaemolyticus]KIT29976.1 hypothetical protein H323_20295 [Vibrio parahaemolyticus VP766]EGR2770787.1 hypothetical protein [Vibrio parahaemolyticus]EGR2833453.1 hypothetical protein [Vibrio parahaemolyticus]EGR2886036.1 hypothetical protein [Vibrio parahaemolyticus]EGR2907991.1 hypothetical protein [Vibrio parahaemolyticus]